MRKLPIIGFLLISLVLIAQNPERQKVEETNSTIESKSIVGMWNQIVPLKQPGGEETVLTTGTFKIVNEDGTFFTFVVWDLQKKGTTIGMYGTYKITSDSTLTEHIIKHAITPQMSGTDSQLRYKMIDENTISILYYNNGRWIPEMWRRTLMYKKQIEN